MRKPLLLITFCCSIFSLTLKAQQETYLTHFNFNKVLYNPAFAGASGEYCLNSFHHRQWIALKDYTGRFRTEGGLKESPAFPARISPVTQGFGFSMPLSRKFEGDRINVGGLYFGFIDDVIAYEKNTSFKAGISFAIPLSLRSELRVGLDANYHTKGFNVAMLRAMDANDPLIPVASSATDSKLLLGSGIYYSTEWNNFYTGLSMSSWNRPEFDYFNQGNGQTYISAARHLYWVAGMSFTKGDVRKQTMMLIKSVNDGNGWVKPQLDLQYHVTYRDLISLGSGIRAQFAGVDAFNMLLGFYPGSMWPRLQPRNGNFRIGYSYDVTLQSLRLSSRNTHEIQINYCFGPPDPVRINHPRDMNYHQKARISKRWRWFNRW